MGTFHHNVFVALFNVAKKCVNKKKYKVCCLNTKYIFYLNFVDLSVYIERTSAAYHPRRNKILFAICMKEISFEVLKLQYNAPVSQKQKIISILTFRFTCKKYQTYLFLAHVFRPHNDAIVRGKSLNDVS